MARYRRAGNAIEVFIKHERSVQVTLHVMDFIRMETVPSVSEFLD